MANKFLNKSFKDMSNEELCAIAVRLKFQLVEARFKMSSGEIEKINIISQIRKTIAKIFTELTNRGYKVSIGSHGVTMYDLKTNKPFSINPKKLQDLINKNQKNDDAKNKTSSQQSQTPKNSVNTNKQVSKTSKEDKK